MFPGLSEEVSEFPYPFDVAILTVVQRCGALPPHVPLHALQELKDLPDNYGYKFLSQEMTRYRMKVVDESLSIRAIEDKIAGGLIEELIF